MSGRPIARSSASASLATSLIISRNTSLILLSIQPSRPSGAIIPRSIFSTSSSDALLSYEVNYLGSINLARVALALGIPYIHISSAATLPPGDNLTEEDHLPLDRSLSNYAKSKLMTEMTLKHMHEKYGLDYTLIRMAIVYGAHDHKIQGINRLLFNIVDRAMPFMLTKKKGVLHSYSNASKVPFFIHHILKNREEFSGQTYPDHQGLRTSRPRARYTYPTGLPGAATIS